MSDTAYNLEALQQSDPASIVTINLYRQGIDDTVAADVLAPLLRKCINLERVFLYMNAVGDSGLQHLADALVHCPKLEYLFLSSNKVTDAGVKQFAAVVPNIPSLKRLSLRDNLLTDAAAEGIAQLLQGCAGLEYLYVHDNSLTLQSKDTIARAVAAHPKLHTAIVFEFQTCANECATLRKHGQTLAKNIQGQATQLPR